MRTTTRSRAALPLYLLALGLASSCQQSGSPDSTEAGTGAVEDMTIVVEADKSRLLQEEGALQAKRAAFDSEHARLAKERSDIADKLSSLSKKDKLQRDKLESAERDLSSQQHDLRDKLQSFDGQRNKLEEDKTRLLERIAKMTATRGGLTVDQREEAVARREREVAQREQQLAHREAEAGHSLQEVARLLELAQRAPAPRAASLSSSIGDAGGAASHASVLRQQQQLAQRLEAKGILMDDLSPSARQLESQANAASAARDYRAAQEALTQLLQAADAISVGHPFLQAKMARISRQVEERRGGRSLDETKQKKVQALLAEASDSFSDGRYDRANKKINQIVGLLQGR